MRSVPRSLRPRVSPPLRGLVCLCLLAAAVLAMAAPADARQTLKKSSWGPAEVGGVSQFPIYKDLGVGIYQTAVNWATIAPTRPAHPTDPADPAYRWPSKIDYALRQGRKYGIRVSVLLTGAPPWANGGRDSTWAPKKPSDFSRFASAASRRWRGVRYWMIWGEPNRIANFKPLAYQHPGRPLTVQQVHGPRLYARILDSAYGALKHVDRGDLVIGGNTWTAGDISPRSFIRAMDLPGGKPPRTDLYGHNPLSARKPNLRAPAHCCGFADFSDLKRLAGWVDRYLGRPRHRWPRLFLSEWFLPTDHRNHELNFWVRRRTAADWTKAALRITRSWSRIYTLGWFSLYDDPPLPSHLEVNRGLLDYRGRKKPAYNVFKRG
jgi:hypothetical protein